MSAIPRNRGSPVRRTSLWAALAAACVAAGTSVNVGCGGEPEAPESGIVRETVGDTVVLRSWGTGAWGEDPRLVEELRIGRLNGPEEYIFGAISSIAVDSAGNLYVLDRQVPALRRYEPDGTYLDTFGGEGGGPGEYNQPDGGLAVLPDGRVLLRDPANARINVYAPDGEYLDLWRIQGNRFTSTPLFVDTAGTVYHPIWERREEGSVWRLVRFGPDGEATDTLSAPTSERRAPLLHAVRVSDAGRSRASRPVPFSPRFVWTFSRYGHFVTASTERFSFTLRRQDLPPLRVEREYDPVQVKAAERADTRERTAAIMRQTQPDWEWNGPSIPDTKPAFRDLMEDLDGRIWVLLHAEAERVPEDELEQTEPGEIPSARWREPLVLAAFEPDGRYLGRLVLPEGSQWYPNPVASGEVLWVVTRGDFDVPYVVRYRIETGGGLP